MSPFINNNLTKTIIPVLLFTMHIPLVYGGGLDYQDRGDRWEGVTPNPVAGSDIELLSALVNYRERWQPIPPNCNVKFYLQNANKVDLTLTVQELHPKRFYLMNRVIPNPSWQSGINNFQWATNVVIKPLHLNIAKLGIVARLKPVTNRETESVAPVILYHTSSPTKINGYLFAFKVGGSAKLSYAIYQGNSQVPLVENDLGKQSVGIPFVVSWDSSKAPAGSYELIIQGHFRRDFKEVRKSVHFYHKPLIN